MKKEKKLLVSVFFLLFIFNFVFGYIFYLNEMRDFRNYAERSGLMFSHQIHDFLSEDFGNTEKTKNLLEDLKKRADQTGLLNVAIFSKDARKIFESTKVSNINVENVKSFIKSDKDLSIISEKKDMYSRFDELEKEVFVTSIFTKKSNYIIIIDINMTTEYRAAIDDVKVYLSVIVILSIIFAIIILWMMKKYSQKIRKYLETISAQKAEAIRLSKIKSEFLATMSHEIRTPINGFLGVLDLMRDTQLNNQQKELLDIAQYSGRHLLTILNDILDFSKIEAGQLKVEKIPINLHKHMESIIAMNKRAAQNKGIDLFLKFRIEKNSVILSDPVRIAQVVQNLLTNAIKFTHQGSVTLIIDAEDSSKCPKPNSRCIIFTIKDTGIGIPEDKIPHLFDKFSQADASTSRLYGGTGLGLAITKKIVNILGGEVWVESILGKGTSFNVLMPLEKTDEQEEIFINQESEESDKIKRKLRVLIVDDNLVNQVVLRGIVEKEEHTVICASSGKDAIALFEEQEFDLIFMDIQMPGMDGFETTHRIRHIETQRDNGRIPIIACSASAVYEEGHTPENNQYFDGEVSKPINREKLKELLVSYSMI